MLTHQRELGGDQRGGCSCLGRLWRPSSGEPLAVGCDSVDAWKIYSKVSEKHITKTIPDD